MNAKHALYYSTFCYFCQKVLSFLRGNNLTGEDVELRNVSESTHHSDLLQGGGKTQVPCLRVETENGDVSWMYESDDIIRYLG